ncbi:MAG: helix-turn-helix transcriptional regulator [bacterium]|nr:helix-turn-helix transcriptional regulator [bacterium]
MEPTIIISDTKKTKKHQLDDKTCGVSKTIRIIGSKWTILILYNLLEGPRRFGELQKLLAGISPRTLSLRLTELEGDGLISKKIFAEVPPHVEYTLTKKGQTLNDVICKMREWGESSIV